MRRPASILWHSASVNGCDLRPHPTYVDAPFWCKQNFVLHGPPQMAENAVRSARRAYGCYSAPKFDPLESRDLKRLARRWASNRRAEQQPGIVVRIGGLADKRMMSGYSPWPTYREGRHAGTSRHGRLAFPRRGSMRLPFHATYGTRVDGWSSGWLQSGAHRPQFQGRLNEKVGGRQAVWPNGCGEWRSQVVTVGKP